VKVEIVGKRTSPNIDKETGELKGYFTELHYVELKDIKPQNKTEVCLGRRAGSINTSMDVSSIEVGENYDLDFDIRTYQGTSRKSLVDFEVI
jgi:hypothetical protein